MWMLPAKLMRFITAFRDADGFLTANTNRGGRGSRIIYEFIIYYSD